MSLLKIAAASLALAFASSQAMAEPIINKPAPAFSGKAADGSTINLADLKGKTVVLEWTNHDCPYVKKHYDRSIPLRLIKSTYAKIAAIISSCFCKPASVKSACTRKMPSGP